MFGMCSGGTVNTIVGRTDCAGTFLCPNIQHTVSKHLPWTLGVARSRAVLEPRFAPEQDLPDLCLQS